MMKAKAKSTDIRISPYKLRPIVNVIRGNRLDKALAQLKSNSVRRGEVVAKTIYSAFSNAKNLFADESVAMTDLFVKEIRVDGGPIVKYFKPGAMGRSSVQRRRLSHLSVVVGKKE